MSLFPLLLYDLHSRRPSRLLDQHFGVGLNTRNFPRPFNTPYNVSALHRGCEHFTPQGYHTGPRDLTSSPYVNKDEFQVSLNVQHFTPEEITVKVTGKNTIIVEGKCEEKMDEHGYVSRNFMRRYVLPEGYDIEKVESKLSSDGFLTIRAHKIGAEPIEYRRIPVQHTGVPFRSVGDKSAKADK